MNGWFQEQAPPTSVVIVWFVVPPAALGKNGPSWARKARWKDWACSHYHTLTTYGRPGNIGNDDGGM